MHRTGMDDAWHCQVCGAGYVVTGLARDCEARHEEEAKKWTK